MKRYVSLFMALLLASAVFAFAACKDNKPAGGTDASQSAAVSDVATDYSGLLAFANSVNALPGSTAFNNRTKGNGTIDKLLIRGNAMQEKLREDKIEEAEGLDAFQAAFEKLNGLFTTAEAAAAKYVKGLYAAKGNVTVTAVYCYMSVSFAADNTYFFAATYTDEAGAEKTAYMSMSNTNDSIGADYYAEHADTYFLDAPAKNGMDAVSYNNITLTLANVLQQANEG